MKRSLPRAEAKSRRANSPVAQATWVKRWGLTANDDGIALVGGSRASLHPRPAASPPLNRQRPPGWDQPSRRPTLAVLDHRRPDGQRLPPLRPALTRQSVFDTPQIFDDK